MNAQTTDPSGSQRPPVAAVEESAWVDEPDYPHRIENHVKVYLHLEHPATSPPLADPHTAPAGTQVRHFAAGRWHEATVTGWTTEGQGVFLSYADGGTYAGPTFGSVILDAGRDVTAKQSRWAVSGATVDGYPLDGVEDGHYCDYEGHPPGARPDWDQQHRDAAEVSLPTADELLPLLATALGTRVEGPTAHQRREAVELINEHAQWRAERADLSAGESAGDIPSASDWNDSDDAGCDLAERAIALLVRISGHEPKETAPPMPTGSTPMMRAALGSRWEGSVRPEPSEPPRAPTPPAP